MRKIAIYETTNILRLRIVKLLSDFNVEIINLSTVKYNNFVKFNHPLDDVDLIMVDIDSLGSKYINFIDALKESSANKDIPIVALSSHSEITMLKQIISYGCVDFIIKPFDNYTFMSKFNSLLYNNDNAPSSYIFSNLDDEVEIKHVSLKWSDEFNLGIDQIDNEHKSLFDHFEKLYALMHESKGHEFYNELITFLTNYVDTHFAHEENFQKQIKYPLLEKHSNIHDSFKRQLKTFIKTNDQTKINDLELIHLSLFLKNWLLHHILIEDQKIYEYYSKEKKN